MNVPILGWHKQIRYRNRWQEKEGKWSRHKIKRSEDLQLHGYSSPNQWMIYLTKHNYPSTVDGSMFLRGPYRQKIICFCAIMHRTTIVQNKIISTNCSWPFFCLANIYRPSLGKVQLGRPNQKPQPAFNFYLRRKKQPFYLELNTQLPDFQFWF